VLLTALVAFAVLGGGAWTAALQMIDLAPKIPEYQSNIQSKLSGVNGYLSGALGRISGTALGIGQASLQAAPAAAGLG